MLIKGQDIRNITVGNTLSNDAHAGRRFDYMLSNPPFGVEWKRSVFPTPQEVACRHFEGWRIHVCAERVLAFSWPVAA